MRNRNHLIREIFDTQKVVDAAGQTHTLDSNIMETEGQFLWTVIDRNPSIEKTLEIGCAQGVSSLFICDAISNRPNRSHTIIDPNQFTEWKSIGVKHLERAGFHFFKVLDKPSEFAMPELLEQEEQFDFVFIDGWHTFDQTLADFFFANRLLKTNGIVAFHDVQMPAIEWAISYVGNYPCYEVLPSHPYYFGNVAAKRAIKYWMPRVLPQGIAKHLLPRRIFRRVYRPNMMVFRKVAEDHRSWDWFGGF
jgi:predicted O-methyltransferase YrrM